MISFEVKVNKYFSKLSNYRFLIKIFQKLYKFAFWQNKIAKLGQKFITHGKGR